MNTKIFFTLLIILLIMGSCTTSQQNLAKVKAKQSNAITKGPKNGTLLVMGGAVSDQFYLKFRELVGGADAPVIYIPTAITSDPLSEADLERLKKRFAARGGFTNVMVLHTRDPKVSNTDAFIAPIKQAKGIWFSGGRQWRHADSYLNTKAHEAFFDLLERGGVIAGSSAGATIQGSYLARGDTKANTIMMGDHEEGLGFITNIAIDQHLMARNRHFDLYEILDNRPELLGIGLDEDTGILVKGDTFEVLGKSYVAIYDGTRWSAERDTIYQLPAGTRGFYFLKAGNQYDLFKRQVIKK